jgi:hypothetical protein
MSFGKGGSTTYTTPELTPEQREQIQAQNQFFTGTIAPTYQGAVRGATDLYNLGAPGVTAAAQNLGGTASQVRQTLGETGESAVRTGIAGLSSLFAPEYERQQLEAALAPAQSAYQTNLQNLQTQFGGAGQLGSMRNALAAQSLAGQTQATQAATAANILRDINAQRLQAGQALSGFGQTGLGQALSAAGTGVTAAMAPQELYNKYASVIFGTPQASYALGPYGQTQTGTQTQFGIRI